MNEDIADALCKANVISFGEFKFASGRESQFYINLRVLPSYPAIFNFISDKASEIVGNLGVDIVAGAEPGGVPLATAVSIKTSLPMVSIKKPRIYQQKTLIEGKLDKNQKAVLITDLITNGYNKLKLIEAIRQEGADVRDIIAILDKEEGAVKNLEEHGITLHHLITLRELLEFMRAHSMIEKERFNQIMGQYDSDS